MKTVRSLVFGAVLLLVLGGGTYAAYSKYPALFAPPCTLPITYSAGDFDSRFGISESAYITALKNAAYVWNKELGRDIFVFATTTAPIPVNLVYGSVQKTAQLGGTIDAQQSEFSSMKTQIQSLKNELANLKATYARAGASLDARAAAYETEVKKWNTQGGAPPDVYDRLTKEAKDIQADEKALSVSANQINALIQQINSAVDSLNALARNLNSKVNAYNKNAGSDFEQGHYIEDENGKRIDVYEFTSTADLTRVLAHEFGHALGLEHVSNPESIMYSYNIGTDLTLSPEDIAELRRVCKLDK